MPLGETWVSPCSTLMSSNGTPSWSATIWLQAVGAGAGYHLDLAGGQHPDRCGLPAARAVGERAEHSGRCQAAHLGEGGDADAEPHLVAPLVAQPLLLAQVVVIEQLLGFGSRRLVVTRVVGQAGDGRVRELLVLDPVPIPQLQRLHSELIRELVHDALDCERRLRP